MSTIKRKLTRKSIMNFGKYADCTVQHILDLQKHRYLRTIYYTNSNIDFFDDILIEIGAFEHKIEKPGKDLDMLEYVDKLADMRISGFNKFKHNQHFKKVDKAKYISFVGATKVSYFKKSANRARNQK